MRAPQTNFIEVYDRALSRDVCAEIVSRFLKSDRVSPGRTGHGVEPSKKRSWDLGIAGDDSWGDLHVELVRALRGPLRDYVSKHAFLLMGALAPALVDADTRLPVSVTPENFEGLDERSIESLFGRLYRMGAINLQRYERALGGYPWWHSEIYPRGVEAEALHRVLFFQFYLNDVDEGGETEFFYQQLRVRPEVGKLLIAPAGFTHTHRGNVPLSEDKFIATSWILFQRAERLYASK